MDCITLENEKFRLVLSKEGCAESLVLKSNGTQCLADQKIPFCSLTEERPYHNEIKLAYPTVKTTFSANRLRLENGKLIVGFEKIQFEAIVSVEIEPGYMVFTLEDFITRPDSFGLGVAPICPPVSRFRMVQLPVAPRKHVGRWLNVVWDEQAAVNVLAASPYAKVGLEDPVLFGETLQSVKLKQAGVALVVSEPQQLLDGIDALEIQRDLPRGVASRRSEYINRSYYWVDSLKPETVDAHIAYAKKGGFSCLLVYYRSFVEENGTFSKTGVYDRYDPEVLTAMLEKIKAAGIVPGLHILHSHIGMKSRYLTPVADHRLNLNRHFTLAKPLSAEDTTIYVEENPEGVPLYEKMRILQFMGELIQYESFTTERPYRFLGCKRGFNDTNRKTHEIGTIGGVLDVSEFSSNSAYINQHTSLQDEVAEQIARLYDTGFEFLYFDGSEGVNPPFDIHVGLAQWRVYSKLKKKPLFCEGAAKSNFSWHILSGGNAFDVWKPEVFKQMVVMHPFAEAERMAKEFTRVNFGWWKLTENQRPDIFEYGTALGAAWDCPGAFRGDLDMFKKVARTDDILETFRRWEDARRSGFVTPEIKERLRRTDREHTLLIDESGGYELAQWRQLPAGDERILAFFFCRKGKNCVACWNHAGSGMLWLPLEATAVSYVQQLGGEELPTEHRDGGVVLPLAEKRYLITELTEQQLEAAFRQARLL